MMFRIRFHLRFKLIIVEIFTQTLIKLFLKIERFQNAEIVREVINYYSPLACGR
jgi:hypothetical protein